MRVILYTGKGGVGKTTVAAATAVKCASLGYKTLVISTDAAHSLGDSVDQEIGDQPTELAPNLWGQEVNALHELEEHWDRIHIYLTSLFASQGVDDIVAEEMASPPGMEEVASLMWIKKHKREGKFDVLIVDCAPTGETLQLLAFPDVAKWYLDRIFPIHRMMNKVARPVMQPFINIPLPSDEIFSNVKDLLLDLEGMKKILGDPKVCTTRIVLNLEKMVREGGAAGVHLPEPLRLPDRPRGGESCAPAGGHRRYFDSWREAQQRYSVMVETAFSPIPTLRTKLFDHEIVGLDSLAEMGESIYGDRDPSQIFYHSVPQRIRKVGNTYELQLHLPFVGKEDVDIKHREGELFVSVGPYKREISLPRVLNGKRVTKGRLDEGMLSVTFADRTP